MTMPDTEPALPSSLADVTRHLFLSPHYDDIALSAGATVNLLALNGVTPETLVIFGAAPDPAQMLSPFAAAMHAGWGLSAEDVVASRQAEERAAAAVIGARSSVLPFRDAIYRGDHYLSNDDLFGEPAAAEGSLPAEIAAALDLGDEPDGKLRVYAPLAVGRHVDHQLVHRVGVDLATRGWDVWFYEDLPYALKPGALDERLLVVDRETPLEPAALVPAETGWQAKIDAILNYPSQLETIFVQYVGVGTSREAISGALAAYASMIGDGSLGERFWRVRHASP
jgi:LmbE family N-acetylglucosaminyl deacetylase